MNNFKPRGPKPETIIQKDLIDFLKTRDWFVKETHGNAYQSGFPDLFCVHKMYGHRWIDVKNPNGYSFTPAQVDTFPKMCAFGSGVWILVAANEFEYQKLFKPCNWHLYLR